MDKNKKIILVAVFVLLLFPIKAAYGQSGLREKLKLLEKGELPELQEKSCQKRAVKNSGAERVNPNISKELDSLMVFVSLQKTLREATFQNNILPYLEKKIIRDSLFQIDFSDDEELVFESFLATFQWENATAAVGLYEDFIARNFTDLQPFQSIFTVFFYIRQIKAYATGSKENSTKNEFCKRLDQEFSEYNQIHWKVFAMQPAALLLWFSAAYIWEEKNEDQFSLKCTEKL